MMKQLFRPKEYFRPTTVDDAVSQLAKYGARSVAGGTDLLVLTPLQVEYVVDITRLPLNYIKTGPNGIKIGSLTTFHDVESSPLLKKGPYTMLVEAAHAIGHANSRNVSTVGGNLCNAVPSADFPPALIALGAIAKIISSDGTRVVPVDEFFVGVRKTVLKSNELLTEIQVPRQPNCTGTAFLKIGRTNEDIALVNAATCVTSRRGMYCEDVRIALGAVAPTPIRAKKAETLLKNKKLEDRVITEAAELAAQETKPISDHRASATYRREMSKVLVRRALRKSIEELRKEMI